jgi:hypothetical protein
LISALSPSLVVSLVVSLTRQEFDNCAQSLGAIEVVLLKHFHEYPIPPEGSSPVASAAATQLPPAPSPVPQASDALSAPPPAAAPSKQLYATPLLAAVQQDRALLERVQELEVRELVALAAIYSIALLSMPRSLSPSLSL